MGLCCNGAASATFWITCLFLITAVRGLWLPVGPVSGSCLVVRRVAQDSLGTGGDRCVEWCLKCWEKSSLIVSWSTTNHTWTSQGPNPVFRREKTATNCRICGSVPGPWVAYFFWQLKSAAREVTVAGVWLVLIAAWQKRLKARSKIITVIIRLTSPELRFWNLIL